ncbi:MAG: CDP-diacylglycerol--glycerol-3-phosphate 3-phosphatidyltransferase [bacterium TMED217]|nr:MAG: CDP-diacylglycerol--glycerol-3-phosphate 3-phosphatidyltransferase [bacterium TMED217]
MNIPNLLSLIRIILTPLFIILLFSDFDTAKLFALLVFVIAAITDAYDGHLARKYNQITPEGKFLDPLADKILVVSAFFSFSVIGIIDYWIVGIIIFRDLFVTGLRLIISSSGFEFVTSKLSKYKTAFQLTIIIVTLIFMAIEGLDISIFIPTLEIIKQYRIIYLLTMFTAIFTVYTGIIYLYTNRMMIRKFIRENSD